VPSNGPHSFILTDPTQADFSEFSSLASRRKLVVVLIRLFAFRLGSTRFLITLFFRVRWGHILLDSLQFSFWYRFLVCLVLSVLILFYNALSVLRFIRIVWAIVTWFDRNAVAVILIALRARIRRLFLLDVIPTLHLDGRLFRKFKETHDQLI